MCNKSIFFNFMHHLSLILPLLCIFRANADFFPIISETGVIDGDVISGINPNKAKQKCTSVNTISMHLLRNA